ncbi:hypothetical protein CEE45_13435 [Candidatus Heimdallarchaeota archaeon B3_Heim]|nr:MAG: hypothetical protein CEE45_13435 [Candidatus Heimdallarchaeota archaeon B3_Heim]
MERRYFICPRGEKSGFCQECPLFKLYKDCVVRSERIESRRFTKSPLVNQTSDRHLVYEQNDSVSEKILKIFLIVASVAPTILISLWEPFFAPVLVFCLIISILIIKARIKTSLRLEGS